MQGTNYFVAVNASVSVALTNAAGNAILVTSTTPFTNASAGYAIGCIMIDTGTGIPYVNTGTAATATWTKVSGT